MIEPVYPKGENDRPPVGLERMLRIYLLQQWFNLSDPGAEDMLHDSTAMRSFVGIDPGQEPVPTILKFRRFLESPHIGQRLFNPVGLGIHTRNLKGLGLSAKQALDPCHNLHPTQTILLRDTCCSPATGRPHCRHCFRAYNLGCPSGD